MDKVTIPARGGNQITKKHLVESERLVGGGVSGRGVGMDLIRLGGDCGAEYQKREANRIKAVTQGT